MTFAILLFFVNVLYSIRNGKKAGPNPWGARTLEWQIPRRRTTTTSRTSRPSTVCRTISDIRYRIAGLKKSSPTPPVHVGAH